MLEGLKERVAIVTGASRGLGRAEAMELAGQGARVIVNLPGFDATGCARRRFGAQFAR